MQLATPVQCMPTFSTSQYYNGEQVIGILWKLFSFYYYFRNFLEKLENNNDSTDEASLDDELKQVGNNLDYRAQDKRGIQGPAVQSILSLMSSLVDKMLTVLVSAIFNSQVFLLKKCEYAKATHNFSAKILPYMPYLMIKVLTIC